MVKSQTVNYPHLDNARYHNFMQNAPERLPKEVGLPKLRKSDFLRGHYEDFRI